MNTSGKIKLRIGIAAIFLLVIVPLTTVMIYVLYSQNAKLARNMARESMLQSSERVVGSVTDLLGNMSRTLSMAVSFGQAQKQSLRQHESLRPMLELLEGMPEAYSLYFGLEESGDFHQVVRISPDMKAFGPYKAAPPKDAKWIIRTTNDQSGERRDTHLYVSEWGKVVHIERSDVTFDPRKRPWYETAVAANTKEVTITNVHMFNGIPVPGITLVKPLLTEDGGRVGVFGAGISVEALAKFLREQKISPNSLCFILDEDFLLMGYPDASKTVTVKDGKPQIVAGEDFEQPVVAQAIRTFRQEAHSDFSLEVDGQTWLAHFEPFPDSLGRKWLVGTIAAEDDFVGPIKNSSYLIVAIGVLFIVVATMGVVLLSRLVVSPIYALIDETKKIRDFDLDGKVEVTTRIVELNNLSSAVASMKAGISSFVRYVPRGLVQQIIRSGSTTEIGGERRPLTVMFTDLQGFTQASEGMEPEQVSQWLSSYFEQMSQAIIRNNGTIDKYIGDAVMAFWNAPAEDEDHIAHGCYAMLACQLALTAGGLAEHGPTLRTRMGLHTGSAMVGNVGSSDRMQYTALGSMVNLASRIEGLNKKFGTELLVTEPVYQAVSTRFHFRSFGPVVVVGASIPLSVYELIGPVTDEPPAYRELWDAAFEAWQAGVWQQALERFEAYQTAVPGDLAASLFIAQCQHYQANGLPGTWDGVLRFSTK